MIPLEKGNALIVVLILAGLMALIALASLERSWLVKRMVVNHQSHYFNFRQAEKKLLILEQAVVQHQDPKCLPNVAYKQFVPDTLLFGEKSGITFYEITLSQTQKDGAQVSLNTTVAKREA